MHLSPAVLVELAEGARARSAEPHLAGCHTCRQKVAELRSAMTAPELAAIDVPEPSPLFWDHFSERVRQAVMVESRPRRGVLAAFWPAAWSGWGMAGALAAAAGAVAIVVAVGHGNSNRISPSSSRATSTAAAVPSTSDANTSADALLLPASGSDDASLTLVAGLAAQLDTESAVETGLATHVGGLDEIVGTLTAGERVELQRLLKDELAKS